MKPSEKSPEMNAFLDKYAMKAFGRSRTESINKNVCVDCGCTATNFEDSLSRKEYSISGLCQACQDKMFGEE